MLFEISYVLHLFLSGVDTGEVEKQRSSKRELEDTIAGLKEICRKLQSEQNHLENEAAKFRRQRVCYNESTDVTEPICE